MLGDSLSTKLDCRRAKYSVRSRWTELLLHFLTLSANYTIGANLSKVSSVDTGGGGGGDEVCASL